MLPEPCFAMTFPQARTAAKKPVALSFMDSSHFERSSSKPPDMGRLTAL